MRFARPALGAAVAVAIGLFLCFALASRFILHGAVSDAAIAKSVRLRADDSMGLLVKGTCRPPRAQAWTCTMTDYDLGGTVTYRVTRRVGSSCWDADLATRGADMPQTLSGCVHAWQWELVDLVGGPDYPH